MSVRYLIIPKHATDDVKELLTLSCDQMTQLKQMLTERPSSSKQRFFELVADTLGIGNDQAIGVITARASLASQVERYGVTSETLLSDLRELAKKLSVDDIESKASALDALLRRDADRFLVEKIASLESSLLPHYVEAKTIVDLRPVFGGQEEDALNVDGYLMVPYLEIRSHRRQADDIETFSVSMSDEDISALIKILKRAKKKMASLRERFAEHGVKIYD